MIRDAGYDLPARLKGGADLWDEPAGLIVAPDVFPAAVQVFAVGALPLDRRYVGANRAARYRGTSAEWSRT